MIAGIRVFRRRWATAGGKVHVSGKVSIAFRDPRDIPREITSFTDEEAAKAFAWKLGRLLAYRRAGEQPDGLAAWIADLPEDMRGFLCEIELLDSERAAAGKPLVETDEDGKMTGGHVADFQAALTARGVTEGHAVTTAERVRQIVRGCGFTRWSEIEAARVLSHLAACRQAPKGRLSAATSNAYLTAFKSFARWMIAERRANENPVAHLKGMNARPDRQRERRALAADECRRLIAAAEGGAPVLGMPGPDRAMLYRVALETGLRWNELRTLMAQGFALDAERPTVTVAAGYSKHRREDVLPLRCETADTLKAYLSLKLPGAVAFPMPAADGAGAIMVRADLTAARATWLQEADGKPVEHEAREKSDTLKDEDSAGRIVDFHALRHTFISNLAAGGVHPKIAQALARHSTIALTMDRYTHLEVANQAAALDALPDLDAPATDAQATRKTGTDDTDFQNTNAPAQIGKGAADPKNIYLTTDRKLTVQARKDGYLRARLGQPDVLESAAVESEKSPESQGFPNDSGPSANGAPGRTRTPDRRIRNPLLYPAELLARKWALMNAETRTRLQVTRCSRT